MAKGHKTGGRQAGTPNKATAELKEIARQYGSKAIEELANLAGLTEGGAKKAESEQARIAALNIILDRGYGKAAQAITGEGGEGPVLIQELLASVDGKTRGLPTGS